jgi:glucokinase
VADRLREHIQREDLQTCILDQAGGHPENIDFRTLVEAVREQDAYAMTVWDDYVEHLAQGIGNLMMIINPGAVLLGTIGIHAADILLEPLRRRIQPYVIPSVYTACTVVPSSLGSTIGDLAALALARQAAVANNA